MSASSFVLSGMFSGEFGAILQQYPALLGVLLPSMNRARESANHMKTLSNLRQIGLSVIMHAQAHNDEMPATLGDTLPYTRSGSVYLSPHSSVSVPEDFQQRSPEDQAKWVNANASYIYLRPAGKLRQIKGEVIVAYENPDLVPPGQPIGAVFGDGHAESLDRARLDALLQAQNAAPGGL